MKGRLSHYINPAVRALYKAAVPLYMLLYSEFYTFLLAINFNIETTVIVTSLFLCLHHAVTVIILNHFTVGELGLNSRLGQFNLGNDPTSY